MAEEIGYPKKRTPDGYALLGRSNTRVRNCAHRRTHEFFLLIPQTIEYSACEHPGAVD